MSDRDTCKSCGKEWVNHDGIQRTCAENMRLKDIIRRASAAFCSDSPDKRAAVDMYVILGEAYRK